MPQITAVLNPVSHNKVTASIPAGKPLHEIMDLPDGLLIERNGYKYQGETLRDDDIINIVVIPQGDTDARKDLARTGIVLAAQVAAAVATQGMSVWAQIGISTAATVGAAIAANALIPLPQPDAAISSGASGAGFQRLGALTGSRNQLSPYGIVPRVYGKRKIYPMLSARPFTEVVANEQYLRLLFVVSAGPLSLTEKTGLDQ